MSSSARKAWTDFAVVLGLVIGFGAIWLVAFLPQWVFGVMAVTSILLARVFMRRRHREG